MSVTHIGYGVGDSLDMVRRESGMELDFSSRQALNQVLTMFDTQQQNEFHQWLSKPDPRSRSGYHNFTGILTMSFTCPIMKCR